MRETSSQPRSIPCFKCSGVLERKCCGAGPEGAFWSALGRSQVMVIRYKRWPKLRGKNTKIFAAKEHGNQPGPETFLNICRDPVWEQNWGNVGRWGTWQLSVWHLVALHHMQVVVEGMYFWYVVCGDRDGGLIPSLLFPDGESQFWVLLVPVFS